MSIRALHYITGDTPQSGFRRIGRTEDFPADDLPWLNNGAVIQERARREVRNARQGMGAGFQMVSHVWEYQTGKYGCPVIINTVGAIGIGRPHSYSEYVAGLTENVAEIGDPASMIRGAERFDMLDLERFATIPGREEISCPEEVWDPVFSDDPEGQIDVAVDETWLLTLVSHFWKQASIRAFSKDAPTTVRVCLGQFSEGNIQADTEETIRRSKYFFSHNMTKLLPRQVQNIASMAAGVNCGNTGELYSALEFDITVNMYEDETLQLRRPKVFPQGYRLNEAEMDFIRGTAEGKTPEAVDEFFRRYCILMENPDLDVLQVPFMADYRVWYTLYCLDQMTKDGGFREKANLAREDNQDRIRTARACFILMRRLRGILENDHHLNESRKSFVSDLLEPLESRVLKTMVADMEQETAQSFLLRRNEMVEFHRHTLYYAPETQVDDLIRLAVLDQQRAKAPQFVRCYPATPLRSNQPQADERNAQLLQALLPAIIKPLIEKEAQRGEIEDKFLEQLRSEEFADRWACLDSNPKTRETMTDFLRQEIEDEKKHFLLYKISLKYLAGKELFLKTLEHFSANHTRPDRHPDERQMKIAAYGAREYISANNRSDPDCLSALNRYYYQCLQEYGSNAGGLNDMIRTLGGDTTEALKMVLEGETAEKRLSPEETQAAFRILGGEGDRYARSSVIQEAYSDLLARHRKEARETKDIKAFGWLCEMTENTPWQDREDWITDQCTENVRLLCDIAEETGETISATSLTRIRDWLQDGKIQQRGIVRLQQYCENELRRGDQTAADALTPSFSRIDESCPGLRTLLFDRVKERFINGLNQRSTPFGTLVKECGPDTVKAGRSLDNLYTETQEQVEEYLRSYFDQTNDLSRLISEQETIPENTAFARSWREKVNERFYYQQVDLFNRQPNLERVMELREEIDRRGSRMDDSLRAAYDLLDEYGRMMEELAGKTEYEAIADAERTIHRENNLLVRTGNVRKKLCERMREVRWPAEEKAKSRSFRHALCAEMMRGVLLEKERQNVGAKRTGKGCPDWDQVLNNLFSDRARMEEATRKPYAEKNLSVLQKLLALVENVRVMVAYGLDETWEEDLIRAIHENPELRRYQSALAGNRKMRELYQLRFDGNDIVFPE